MCAHTCLWVESEVSVGLLPSLPPPAFVSGSPTELPDSAESMTSEHQGSSHLHFLSARIFGAFCSDWHFVDTGNLNSGPRAYAASSLTNQPSLQSPYFFK